MKILCMQSRITKIIKKLTNPWADHENYENLRNPCEKKENRENHRNPIRNYENV